MSAPKFLYLTYGTWEEGFDPEAYWSKEEDDDVTYVRGDLYDKLRESLAAKERECERLRNRAREISEDYVPQHESEVALALDEMRTAIAALAEGEPDKPCTNVEKHASYVLGRIVATIRDNKGNYPEAVLHLVVIVLNNAGIDVFTHDAIEEGGEASIRREHRGEVLARKDELDEVVREIQSTPHPTLKLHSICEKLAEIPWSHMDLREKEWMDYAINLMVRLRVALAEGEPDKPRTNEGDGA